MLYCPETNNKCIVNEHATCVINVIRYHKHAEYCALTLYGIILEAFKILAIKFKHS
jgi:hypothetical protein